MASSEQLKPASFGFWMALVGVALVAIVSGGGAGWYIFENFVSLKSSAPVCTPVRETGGQGYGDAEQTQAPSGSVGIKIKEIPPIMTNLAGDKSPWIRVEGSLLYEAEIESDMVSLTSKIGEDILVYFRGVTPQQLGVRGGFIAVLEDLNDRVRIRSRGKVHEFIISSFILE